MDEHIEEDVENWRIMDDSSCPANEENDNATTTLSRKESFPIPKKAGRSASKYRSREAVIHRDKHIEHVSEICLPETSLTTIATNSSHTQILVSDDRGLEELKENLHVRKIPATCPTHSHEISTGTSTMPVSTDEKACQCSPLILEARLTNSAIRHQCLVPPPADTSSSSKKATPPLSPAPSTSGSITYLPLDRNASAKFYRSLKRYLATPKELKKNHFPNVNPNKPDVIRLPCIIDLRKHSPKSKPNERICYRCGSVYEVNPDGSSIKQETCFYHPGGTVASSSEKVYSCCNTSIGLSVSGCKEFPSHVIRGNYDEEILKDFVQTHPKTPPPNGDYGVYALDCEMVFTTQGMELARVSVVGTDLNVVYDTYVKPANPVVDYVTRHSDVSNITEEVLADVTTTLEEVRYRLLEIFNVKTILIGHSLENDLTALRMLHQYIVDTSLVFPHPKGFPWKRSLRSIAKDKLGIEIHTDDTTGHNSIEDARTCMQIMLAQTGFPWMYMYNQPLCTINPYES